jgi:hypothetical protein
VSRQLWGPQKGKKHARYRPSHLADGPNVWLAAVLSRFDSEGFMRPTISEPVEPIRSADPGQAARDFAEAATAGLRIDQDAPL